MDSPSGAEASRKTGRRLPFRGRRGTRTPTILQMEAVECGAASLAIVLAHYGAWIPLEELRAACGVSRDGSKASNVVRAARRYGLVARGFSVEPVALHQMPMPCIIHWNFNHFVVLEGIDSKHAYVNDPAIGRRRVGLDELDRAFTGVVLVFERGEAFRKIGTKPKGTRLLLRELRNSKTAVVLLIVVSIALVVPNVVAAGFSKIFVDDILIQHSRNWLVPLLIGMAVTAAFRAALTILRQSLLMRLQAKLSAVTTSRFLWRVLGLPLEFFTQRHAGDIANRVAANETIARLLSSGIASNALSLMSVLLFAAAYADLDLDAAVFEIEGEGDEGGALGLEGLFEFSDFALVGEESALAKRIVVELGGGCVGVDVAAVEDELPFFDAGVGFLELSFAGAEAFDLAAHERDAAFELGLDEEFVERAAVGDARGHVGLGFGHLG